jgi:hypothetical protein
MISMDVKISPPKTGRKHYVIVHHVTRLVSSIKSLQRSIDMLGSLLVFSSHSTENSTDTLRDSFAPREIAGPITRMSSWLGMICIISDCCMGLGGAGRMGEQCLDLDQG